MPERGLFITFEGGEGAGKSTLISSMHRFLEDKGFTVLNTFEPGDTKLGRHLRKIILEEDLHINEKSELFLFLADRAQHVKDVIMPSLLQGKIILCDRFHDSTIAYQGTRQDFDIFKIMDFCQFAADNLNPDLTFILDLDPHEGLQRIERTSDDSRSFDRIEKKQSLFHETVRDNYMSLAIREKKRIVVLDASQSKIDLLQNAINVLRDKLSLAL